MKSSMRRLLVTTAVYLGALFLFGPLTVYLLKRAVEIGTGIIGMSIRPVFLPCSSSSVR